MRVIIYTRTRSGTGDASRQLEQCRALAADRGWDVSEVFTDEDVSGCTLDRTGLVRAMQRVRSRGCDVLVADALEVLTRRAFDLDSILADADAAGVIVYAGPFSSSDAAGRAALKITARL